jgi:hypothetical protein
MCSGAYRKRVLPREQSVFSRSISRNKTRAIAARISHGLARERE